MDQTRPYFQALKAEVKRIFRTSGHVESRYLYPDEGELPPDGHVRPVWCITADKGHGGSVQPERAEGGPPPDASRASGDQALRGGRVRTAVFPAPSGAHRAQLSLYPAQNPTMQRAREITRVNCWIGYDKGELQKIFVIYTDMKNSPDRRTVSATRMLPFHRVGVHRAHGRKAARREPFEFLPVRRRRCWKTSYPAMCPASFTARLIDSFCSEAERPHDRHELGQRKRGKDAGRTGACTTTAIRQAAITQEITEVSAGARAQKRKRQKQHAQGRES